MNGYLYDWMTGSIERIEGLEDWKLGSHSRVPPQGGLADIHICYIYGSSQHCWIESALLDRSSKPSSGTGLAACLHQSQGRLNGKHRSD